MATSKSNKHTGFQHDHLVPLDAISQSNRIRIALTRSDDYYQVRVSRGLSNTLTQGHQVPKVLSYLKWPATRSIYRGRPQTSHYLKSPSKQSTRGLSASQKLDCPPFKPNGYNCNNCVSESTVRALHGLSASYWRTVRRSDTPNTQRDSISGQT